MITVRPMRGQCVVREIVGRASSSIWTPDPANPRDVLTHRGTVLAMGAPSQVNGHDVPWLFDVGDTVLFHHEKWEKGATRPWTDGVDAIWLGQVEIDAVVE